MNNYNIEEQVFKHNKVPVNLIQHCLEVKSKYNNLKVFIGCDSIAVGGKIHYFVVLSFCSEKKGVHCIYSKNTIDSFPSKSKSQKIDAIYRKLERESEITMSVAEYLVNNKVLTREDIIVEFDYNEVPKEVSNRLIGAAKGWAEYAGYQHLCKIPHNHVRPQKTPIENMVCLGDPTLINGRPLHPQDWTDIQRSCRYADHLCRMA
jgi:predicted RNase H-related nuclease YkuK (DUF458 family)